MKSLLFWGFTRMNGALPVYCLSIPARHQPPSALTSGSPRFSAAGEKLCWSKPARTRRALRQDPCQVGLKLKLKGNIDDDDQRFRD